MRNPDYAWEIRANGAFIAGSSGDFLPELYHRIGILLLDPATPETAIAYVTKNGRTYAQVSKKTASLVVITKENREPIDFLPVSF